MTDHKVVLITGASSGIGRATAGLLTSHGYRGFGTAPNPDTHRRTKSMVSRLSLLAVMGALALAGHARADGTQAADTYFAIAAAAPDGQAVGSWLCPLDAHVVALGEGSAVVYYTYDAEGADVVRVVTTVATDPDGAAAPTRFVSYLSPGQKAEVAVAGAVGTAPAVLELAYDGVYLAVRSAAAQPEA